MFNWLFNTKNKTTSKLPTYKNSSLMLMNYKETNKDVFLKHAIETEPIKLSTKLGLALEEIITMTMVIFFKKYMTIKL